jgi:serine/threonine protein kinase
MEPVQLWAFIRQMLSAIEYCHDHRCLHRDIKPDNLLLDCARRSLKLADFGMARAATATSPDPLGRGPPHHTPGMVTAWYRPPELMLGETAYGEPVDVWSAGCIVGEMANLEPLFAANTEVRPRAPSSP